MNIIAFGFNKISAEKKKQTFKDLEVATNIAIEDIKEDNVENLSSNKALRFEFTFSINYSPDIAIIEVKGFVIGLTEKEEYAAILKNWKTKEVNPGFRIPLTNFIMNKCNIKAIDLEEQLNIPLHIPFPQITAELAKKDKDAPKEKKPANYTG